MNNEPSAAAAVGGPRRRRRRGSKQRGGGRPRRGGGARCGGCLRSQGWVSGQRAAQKEELPRQKAKRPGCGGSAEAPRAVRPQHPPGRGACLCWTAHEFDRTAALAWIWLRTKNAYSTTGAAPPSCGLLGGGGGGGSAPALGAVWVLVWPSTRACLTLHRALHDFDFLVLTGACQFGHGDDDELIVRASAVLKSQGPEAWSRGRPGDPPLEKPGWRA